MRLTPPHQGPPCREPASGSSLGAAPLSNHRTPWPPPWRPQEVCIRQRLPGRTRRHVPSVLPPLLVGFGPVLSGFESAQGGFFPSVGQRVLPGLGHECPGLLAFTSSPLRLAPRLHPLGQWRPGSLQLGAGRKRTVAVVGGLAILGTTLKLASGSVTLAERVLTLMVKGNQVLAGEASAATPDTCKTPRK